MACASRPVHPRACGEQIYADEVQQVRAGSSPRVRGTASVVLLIAKPFRFIPARAGNRAPEGHIRPASPVHPRACGEQVLADRAGWLAAGSSPRVRGTAPTSRGSTFQIRFIPARAGNSRWCRSGSRRTPVHPRACGEQCAHLSFLVEEVGSSPRVRGTAGCYNGSYRWSRFIPARAGNRKATVLSVDAVAVHPRACGEQFSIQRHPIGGRGSSPRVRGTAPAWRSRWSGRRFIPARAGNSYADSLCAPG